MPGRKLSGTAGTGNIGCPFFVAHGGRDIMCEGRLQEGNRTIERFPTEGEREQYELVFCECQWKKCYHYDSMMKYVYPEEEGE